MLTISPAYGRDYKSIKAVKSDFDEGKDFIIENIENKWCGKPCNKNDLKKLKIKIVLIRYSNRRKITEVKI